MSQLGDHAAPHPARQHRGFRTDEGNVFPAYLRAVSVAALVFALMLILREARADNWRGQMADGWALWIFLLFGGALVAAYLCFWISALIAALVPFGIAYAVARRFGITNGLYYCACGAVTGLVLQPVAQLIGRQQFPKASADYFFDAWTFGVPLFMVYGVCGAITFWRRVFGDLEREQA